MKALTYIASLWFFIIVLLIAHSFNEANAESKTTEVIDITVIDEGFASKTTLYLVKTKDGDMCVLAKYKAGYAGGISIDCDFDNGKEGQ